MITFPATGTRWPLDVFGHYAVAVADYTGPDAGAGGYSAGGEAVTAGQVKLGAVEVAFDALAPGAGATDTVIYHYNISTGKVQAFWGNGAAASQLTEVTAGTDLSAYTGRLVLMGRG